MITNLVLTGDCYNNLANTVKSKHTLVIYKYGLTQFMHYLQISDVNNLMVLSQDAKALQYKIIDYVMRLRQRSLAPSSVKTLLASVVHFYTMNDVSLNRKKIGAYLPSKDDREEEENEKSEDRPYTLAEISRLLEFCDLRNRAIVLLFASTGVRIGSVPRLRLEHLTKIEKYFLYKIKVYASSKNHR